MCRRHLEESTMRVIHSSLVNPRAGLAAAALVAIQVLAGTSVVAAGAGDEPRVIPGPKRTVAVSRFASKSDFDFEYGLTDVGGGLADLLTSALVESGLFIVVERETLTDVLDEQKLGESGLVAADGAARVGNLVGASLLIKGAVTEFNESAAGNGFGIGFAGFGVGVKSRKATVGLDIQVISTATGQVIATYPVRESLTSRSVGLDVAASGVDSGFSQFEQTALGQAARRAMTEAVRRFADAAASQPWTGQVVAFDAGEVVINAGASSGIRVGDAFTLERPGPVFTDPATGRVLGQRTRRIGRALVSAVDGELAFADFLPAAAAVPMRGDLVVVE
jgi:curli biogenesis system outer membrane secretion channel CsgG